MELAGSERRTTRYLDVAVLLFSRGSIITTHNDHSPSTWSRVLGEHVYFHKVHELTESEESDHLGYAFDIILTLVRFWCAGLCLLLRCISLGYTLRYFCVDNGDTSTLFACILCGTSTMRNGPFHLRASFPFVGCAGALVYFSTYTRSPTLNGFVAVLAVLDSHACCAISAGAKAVQDLEVPLCCQLSGNLYHRRQGEHFYNEPVELLSFAICLWMLFHGIPCLEIHMFTTALATVCASAWRVAFSSTSPLNWSTITKMYRFLCREVFLAQGLEMNVYSADMCPANMES
ncbi:hypothetical protein Pelo_17577 [Pelomyxa schiedti]|nr:hypothetical protein Pelo_17577 [Pelomyxa schiedti]